MTIRYGAGGVPYKVEEVEIKVEEELEVKTVLDSKPKRKKTITNDQQLSEGQETLQELIDENSEILND